MTDDNVKKYSGLIDQAQVYNQAIPAEKIEKVQNNEDLELCDNCGSIIDITEWHEAVYDSTHGEFTYCSKKCKEEDNRGITG